MPRPSSTPRPQYRALLQLLRTSDFIWSASRGFFAKWDLSPAQFNLLNLLSDQSQGLTQTDLGRQLLTHRSNITGLVDRLEARGLVLRQDEVADRRSWRVVLTPKGVDCIQRILPEYYQAAELLWSGISASRAEQVRTVLERVQQNAEVASQSLSEDLG